MKKFKFKISHNLGFYTQTVITRDLQTAKMLICKAESCPESALKLISETEQYYKVVKIFRVSRRREIIRRGLTESEAQRLVRSYPDSARSMVVYEKQN